VDCALVDYGTLAHPSVALSFNVSQELARKSLDVTYWSTDLAVHLLRDKNVSIHYPATG